MRVRTRIALLAVCALCGCARCSPAEPSAARAPTVRRIQPSAPAVGDTVTFSGTGFTRTENTIKIGSGYLAHVSASDTSTLRFALPAFLSPCPPEAQVCIQIVLDLTPGTYPVSVINANGTSIPVTMQVVAK
ncbi:MAG TPA: IPT/TIG domain-containing protein [Vicinamibacterales bacterium]